MNSDFISLINLLYITFLIIAMEIQQKRTSSRSHCVYLSGKREQTESALLKLVDMADVLLQSFKLSVNVHGAGI